MDLLIKNMEMPKEGDTYGLHLVIYTSGEVWIAYDDKPITEAIEIPSHGRLVDAYKLRTAIEDDIEATAKNGVSVDGAELWKILNRNLEFSPTVLEANNGTISD